MDSNSNLEQTTRKPLHLYDSIRVLLALAAQRDLEIKQFDVRTAFLYGELKENIYMVAPEGLELPKNNTEMVCKLKSLYGLKQSPRCWNLKFNNFLKMFKFKESHADKCIYRGIVKDKIVYLALFVDDGLIISESKAAIQAVITKLESLFEITVSDVSTFIGIQIECDRAKKQMFIHQSMYTRCVLEKFNFVNAKGVSVPADPHTTLVMKLVNGGSVE